MQVCYETSWKKYEEELRNTLLGNIHEWSPFVSIDYFFDGLKNEKFYLIVCKDGEEVEAFVIYSIRAKYDLAIIWGGGKKILKHVYSLDLLLRDIAERFGLKAIELTGQPAWERTLKSYGFQKTRVTMRKEL